MSDDFFGEIDQIIDSRAQEAAAVAAAKEAAQPNIAAAISASAKLARDYSLKLKERGISLSVSEGVGGVVLELRHGDGTSRTLSYCPSESRQKLEAVGEFPDERGRRFTSTDGSGDQVANWTADMFKVRLERFVKDYVFYAPRHRGMV